MFRATNRRRENAMRSIEVIRNCLTQMKSLDSFSSTEKQVIGEAAVCLDHVIQDWAAREDVSQSVHRQGIYRVFSWFV